MVFSGSGTNPSVSDQIKEMVDDDPTILLLMRNILKKDYDILLAEHGRAALAVFEENHIDLMITGIKMEPMDGDRLLEIIQVVGVTETNRFYRVEAAPPLTP